MIKQKDKCFIPEKPKSIQETRFSLVRKGTHINFGSIGKVKKFGIFFSLFLLLQGSLWNGNGVVKAFSTTIQQELGKSVINSQPLSSMVYQDTTISQREQIKGSDLVALLNTLEIKDLKDVKDTLDFKLMVEELTNTLQKSKELAIEQKQKFEKWLEEQKRKEEEERLRKERLSSPYIYSLSQFMFKGRVRQFGYEYTYYSQQVLPGGALKIPGRHVDENGYVVDGEGYIVLATSYKIARGTILPTPFGKKGKVYDRIGGSSSANLVDVYIR